MSQHLNNLLPPSTAAIQQHAGLLSNQNFVDQLRKESAALVMQTIQQNQQVNQARQAKISSIVNAEYSAVQTLTRVIKQSAALDAIVELANSGFITRDGLQKLSGQGVNINLAQMMQKASQEAEETIAAGAAEGALAEDDLEDALMEAAESDPAAAAAIISDETGMDVTPEEVEAAVMDAGEAIASDEMTGTDEGVKTSAAVNTIAAYARRGFEKSAHVLSSLSYNYAAALIQQNNVTGRLR
jgi:hypothetical protein